MMNGAGILVPIFLLLLCGCGTAAEGDGDPNDADSPADGDADADLEGDADEELDADLDIATDADADLDFDTDGDVEFDADPDTESGEVEDADIDGDGDGDEDTDGDLDADVDEGEPVMEPLFAFAVIADTHVTGAGENADRLAAAVEWINDHTEEAMIDVVLVLGDIAWGGGFELARDRLDELDPPYVPIIGDNEVHAGDEDAFEATFSDQYDLLADTFESWQRAETPVWNPVAERDSWFMNMAFEHHGVHFVGLDLASRDDSGLAGETGDLHEFDGGTWDWFEGVFEDLPKDVSESIVMASHIPMHMFAFTAGEMRTITTLLGPHGDAVYGNMAGHVHMTYEMGVLAGGYRVYVTDATHDDENTVRLVHVEGNGRWFEYSHELIAVE